MAAAVSAPAAPALDLSDLFYPEDELVLANQFSDLIFVGRLSWLLEAGHYTRFLHELQTASQEQMMVAIGFAAKTGNIAALGQLVRRLEPSRKIHLNRLLPTIATESVSFLLNFPAACHMPTVNDLTEFMRAGTLSPATLLTVLQYMRPLLYLVDAPKPMAGLPGWGMATMFVRRNEIYAQYAAVIASEKARVRAIYWRILFWGTVMRIRIAQFQARYWGPGGAGYLAAKASFEAARALYVKKTN